MTQEEKQLLLKDLCARLPLCDSNFNSVESIDCLNAHHFDYRGLIGKNLAINRGMTQEDKELIRKICYEILDTHTDWTGTYVGVFVNQFLNYIKKV